MAQTNEDLPVIVQLIEDNDGLKNGIMGLATVVRSNLPLINALACSLNTDTIHRLANSPDIEYISFDSKVFTQLDIAVPTMDGRFPQERGYKGKDITIAVVDTGIAPHQDLTQPRNRIIGFKDFVKGKSTPYDDNGHGTHVAGIIAGNGYSSRGKYAGIAPESNILAIKALDENGGGSTSNIIEAISYIIQTKNKYNTKIINFSMGTPSNSPCEKDPLCKAVDKAVNAGIVVVAAAGNSGPNRGTIVSPGTSKKAITVGAVDDKSTIDISDDTIANFSSRGPTNQGDLKPDIVAPGVNINSLSNTRLDGYSSSSGTSMATPLISGAVALLLNKDGKLNPKEVKARLMQSSIDLKNSPEMQGAGLLNLKVLFEQEDPSTKNPQKSDLLGGELVESLIMILILIFLLDSRV